MGTPQGTPHESEDEFSWSPKRSKLITEGQSPVRRKQPHPKANVGINVIPFDVLAAYTTTEFNEPIIAACLNVIAHQLPSE